MNLGQTIRQLRIQKKVTLHKVSIGADIDMTLLSKIERCERLPTVDQLKRLCAYFEASESVFMAMLISNKIIKDYGINSTTYDAIQMVHEQFASYNTFLKK